MKLLNIISLILLLILSGCLDQVPTNRPTLQKAVVNDTPEEEPQAELLEIPVRPNGAVIIQPGHCACQSARSISIGNCDATCASKASTETPQLFFDVELTEAITLDTYGDLNGWCLQQIIDPNTGESASSGTPNCKIEAKDESGTTQLIDFVPGAGQTSFSINTVALDFNKTYRLTIIEQDSGARSTTIQLRKKEIDDSNDPGGPLALMPVNEFTCLTNTNSNNSGGTEIESAKRSHFYFVEETRPEPLLENQFIFCHDKQQFGSTPINSPLLEEKTGAFTVWNRNDPRFFDLDGDEELQIHNIIEKEVERQGQTLTSTPRFFFELIWPNGITVEADSDEAGATQSSLGFYMSPFIDQDTFRAFCPTQEHYYSSNPIFKAMREVVGVDTEALYVGKEAVQGGCDFVLVRESDLKKIWFYIENGQHIQPNDSTITGKKVQFYWPPAFNSPFVRKSFQRTYTLQRVESLNCGETPPPEGGNQNGDGVR